MRFADFSFPHLTAAISPCPNDMAIFGAWILGRGKMLVDMRTLFAFADVDELNQAAAEKKFDLIKVSAAQALRCSMEYAILSCGGAFGTEHGPKLVSANPEPTLRTIAVPGLTTTAATLLRRAMALSAELLPMRYDLIVSAVREGRVDAGLLIHESALLLDRYGLHCLLDLGGWWFDQTQGLPLPLGCILGRRSLGKGVLRIVEQQIRSSLMFGQAHPQAVRPLIQAMAQELDDHVLDAHIHAYVNEYSRDMGDRGRLALDRLSAFASEIGEFPSGSAFVSEC